MKSIISKATICLRDLQRSILLNSLQRPPWEFHSFSVRTKVYRVRARVGVRWIPQDPLWKRQTFIYYNMKVISNSRNKQLPDERLHPYTRWRCTRTLASLALIQSLHNYVLMIAPNLIACGVFFFLRWYSFAHLRRFSFLFLQGQY